MSVISRVSATAATSDARPVRTSIDGIAISIASSPHAEDLVFGLRYDVYVGEQGKRPLGADHAKRRIVDELDPFSFCWLALQGNRAVASLRRTDLDALDARAVERAGAPLAELRNADIGRTTFSSRLVMDREFRRGPLLAALLQTAFAQFRSAGGRIDVMNTNPALVKVFERLGFRRFTSAVVHEPGAGLLIPMLLPAADRSFLAKTGAIFAEPASSFPDAAGQYERIARSFPLLATLYDADRNRSAVQACHVSQRTLERLLTLGYVHRFIGGPLRRAGERVTTLFLPLDGALRAERPDVGYPIVATGGDVPTAAHDLFAEMDSTVLCVPLTAIGRLAGVLRDCREFDMLFADPADPDGAVAAIDILSSPLETVA